MHGQGHGRLCSSLMPEGSSQGVCELLARPRTPREGICCMLTQREMCPLDEAAVAAFFPLQQCIRGLGALLRDLMGVSLESAALAPGACPAFVAHARSLPC